MRHFNKKLLLLPVFLLLSLQLAAISTVNPQVGESAWTVASNIGTVLDEISQYEPTEISNSFPGSTGTTITISSSGVYRVSENLTKQIVISADNVELDLNGYGISVNSIKGIEITGGKKRIVIHNGWINANASYGIWLQFSGSTSSDIYIDNIKVYDSSMGIYFYAQTAATLYNCFVTNCTFSVSGYGIYFSNLNSMYNIFIANCNSSGEIRLEGASGKNIENCEIYRCHTRGSRGIFLWNIDYGLVSECRTQGNSIVGFYLSSCNACHVFRCYADDATGSGFESSGGARNLFENCTAKECGTGFTIDANDHHIECAYMDSGVGFAWYTAGNQEIRP